MCYYWTDATMSHHLKNNTVQPFSHRSIYNLLPENTKLMTYKRQDQGTMLTDLNKTLKNIKEVSIT